MSWHKKYLQLLQLVVHFHNIFTYHLHYICRRLSWDSIASLVCSTFGLLSDSFTGWFVTISIISKAVFPYVCSCVVCVWYMCVRYACQYGNPAIAQARICVRHPFELLLVLIKTDGAHAYAWMKTLSMIKPVLIWYRYAHKRICINENIA